MSLMPHTSRRRKTKLERMSETCKPEDFCFVCFGGGKLKICDRRSCPKGYHYDCITWEKSVSDGNAWNCEWHTCSNCGKFAHYLCNTCTYSLCKGCISELSEANFSCLRGRKCICKRCMEIAMLIEKNELGNQEMPMDLSVEDSSDEDGEDTPEKAEQGKKMLAESATKTPIADKEAKLAIPQITGKLQGKKMPAESATKTPIADKEAKLVISQITGPNGKKTYGHISTPHPSISNNHSKEQTQISAGQIGCMFCHRKFKLYDSLQAHIKAKHRNRRRKVSSKVL